MMPERFDLLKISYMDTRDEDRKHSSWFAYAPVYKISIGDIIDTAFGRAVVLDKVSFVGKQDSMFRLIDGSVPIDRVLFKVESVKYEDNDEI